MKAFIRFLLLASTATAAAAAWAETCQYADYKNFEVGRDEKGYFIRTRFEPAVNWAAFGYRTGGPYQSVGDYLARETGAAIVYFSIETPNRLERGEWRGTNPLSCFASFAKAAGLEVIESKDLWIVGPREDWFRGRVGATLLAQPADPKEQGFLPAREVGEVERALVSQLPVRDATVDRSSPQMSFAGVTYYWLTKEGRDTLLVVGSSSAWTRHLPATFKIFKVRLDRSGEKLKVKCIWAAEENAGRLLPEISEDFDGDGYRDFVFDSGGADHVPNQVVLSGKDGRRLLAFNGNEIAVEKAPSGPPRVAVPSLFDEGVLEEPQVSRGLTGKHYDVAPHVMRYSGKEQAFAIDRTAERRIGAAGATEGEASIREHPGQLLARAAGGLDKVRVYVFGQANLNPYWKFEQVVVPRPDWRVAITADDIKQGYPAHILYEYKSPGYLAAEEERKKASAKN